MSEAQISRSNKYFLSLLIEPISGQYSDHDANKSKLFSALSLIIMFVMVIGNLPYLINENDHTQLFNFVFTILGLVILIISYLLNRYGFLELGIYLLDLSFLILIFTYFEVFENNNVDFLQFFLVPIVITIIFLNTKKAIMYIFIVIFSSITYSQFSPLYDLQEAIFGPLMLLLLISMLVIFAITVARDEQKEIQERTSILEKQLYQSQKLEALGKLAFGIVHDFNNQIFNIQGNAEIALTHNEIPKEIRVSLENILISTEIASDLSDKILNIGKTTSYKIEKLSIKNITNELITLLQHSLSKKIKVVAESPTFDVSIQANKNMLLNAFLNIAINSKDAMPLGGKLVIYVDIDYLDKNFTSMLLPPIPPGDYISICIRDNGIGISDEDLPKIFEPFYTTKDEFGTGIGLTLVYTTIKSHNGAIKLESKVGEGTCFTVYLPAVLPYNHKKLIP